MLGASPDRVAAQQKFAAKLGLPFRLLSDADHTTAERYGVWAEKSLYGRKYFGMNRVTFVIGPDGRFSAIFPKVRIDGHAAETLAAAKEAAARAL